MKRPTAAAGSALFFAVAPGVVAGVMPYLLTGWETGGDWWPPLRVLGAALVAVSGAALVQAFARFVVEGLGTPAPSAPTEQLVIGGPYRYVRNVMYIAVTGAIVCLDLLQRFPHLARAAVLIEPPLLWLSPRGPEVVGDLVRRRVLVLEYVEGTRIDRLQPRLASGELTRKAAIAPA